MKEIHFVCLIVIGITSCDLHSVNCCKDIRARRQQTEITTPNGEQIRKIILLPYDNENNSDCDSRETNSQADGFPDLITGITLETSKKIKRSSPTFQSFPSHNDSDPNDNSNKTVPLTLIATIGNDDNKEALSDNQKTKRNPSDDDPLMLQKLRRARDKKFMCLCEETKCRNKECIQKLLQADTKKSSQENNSAEDLRDENEVLQETNGPKKFNIPFANNVNFDQRVQIVDGKDVPKPPPNTFYPGPQIYHYNPYTLTDPRVIYTGMAPSQQNYAPTTSYSQFPSPSPIPANLLKLWKNGAQNLLPADNNSPIRAPEYVPNFSSESAKSDFPKEPSKVTTPRQIDGKFHPMQNDPSRGNFKIEDTRPAYSYSTDFAYNQHYTTEVVAADDLKFIGSDASTESGQMPFVDPTTMNYAPSYLPPQGNNYDSGISNEYPSNYQIAQQNQYSNVNVNAANDLHYDSNGMPVPNAHSSQEVLYNPQNGKDLSIEVDKVIDDRRNNAPAMSVPNDADLRAYDPPQKQPVRTQDLPMQPPSAYNIEKVNVHQEQQSKTEVHNSVAMTLQEVNGGQTSHYNPQRTSTLRDTSGSTKNKKNEKIAAAPKAKTKADSMEDLFRGLEKVILSNDDVSDSPEIQAVDDRPATTYESTYENFNSTIVQNAVKKVLNNFVPGKAEDLLANYDGKKSRELSRKNGESLSPDVASARVLKNLLKVPEVERMIVDTTNNLINQVMGSPASNKMIKNTLRNVVSDIPKPTSRKGGKIRFRIAKRRPRYEESSNREVVEKIKSIIDKSELGEEAATHPLARNLIVKTVKHSIDKERGVADEAAIRRAFNQVVKSGKQTGDYRSAADRNNQVAAEDPTYTRENTSHKIAPTIAVKERRLQNGVWVEVLKNLAGARGNKSATEEKRRMELEKQLDMLEQYNKSVSTKYVNDESSEKINFQNADGKSDVSTRQTLSKYYDAFEVTTDPKNYPTHMQPNGRPVMNPIVTTINYQNYRDPMYATRQQQQENNNNRLNLLVDSADKSSTESHDPAYMGKLVPASPIKGSPTDGSSDLVWVGDGVRLPLTMRKMPDGSFALTLSDEVCQMFAHKKCPCCLPAAGQGVIVRERRDSGESDFADETDEPTTSSGNYNYRVRRDSAEVVTTATKPDVRSFSTFPNLAGKHDFNSDDYEESDSAEVTAPYKYQRYASQDRIISGRTRALGNMLKWMKDVVTETLEKRQRRH